jgi:S-formylglutathione hydrolase FrmB
VRSIASPGLRFAIALALPLLVAAAPDEPKPLGFEITYTTDIYPGPITTRVYVMLGSPLGSQAPRFGPDWFDPQPFFAVDVRDWKAGEALRIGPDACGFPGALRTLKAGDYAIQAVVRLNPDTHALGNGEGNAYGPVIKANLDPSLGGVVALRVDQRVPPRTLEQTERVKLVDIPSPLLSAFHHRPIRHRAAVILPEGDLKRKRATLYIIPGFGGDHRGAPRFLSDRRKAYGEDLIRVVLDPDCGTGHHAFADSATNGPRGRALIEELMPYLEQTFPALAEPRARLLNGHSSGGWSSLWLQVTYPDSFGGTWSTSPDPVDFRNFQRIDLYAQDVNLFHDAQGNRRPIARKGDQPRIYFDSFSRMEDVQGEGGQLHSFEAVFSPIDRDGKPRKLWDRLTGVIDPDVAKAWEVYDIRLILERNWKALAPKLAGKIHVVAGDLDTYYLEGAVKLLKESLQELGSDAVVEIVPGRDHSNLLDAALAERFDREMMAALARDQPAKPAGRSAAPGGR